MLQSVCEVLAFQELLTLSAMVFYLLVSQPYFQPDAYFVTRRTTFPRNSFPVTERQRSPFTVYVCAESCGACSGCFFVYFVSVQAVLVLTDLQKLLSLEPRTTTNFLSYFEAVFVSRRLSYGILHFVSFVHMHARLPACVYDEKVVPRKTVGKAGEKTRT